MSIEGLRAAERRRLQARPAYCAYCGADAPQQRGMAFADCGECDGGDERYCETCGGLRAATCVCRGRNLTLADGAPLGDGIGPITVAELRQAIFTADIVESRSWYLAMLGWARRVGVDLVHRADVVICEADVEVRPHRPPCAGDVELGLLEAQYPTIGVSR